MANQAYQYFGCNYHDVIFIGVNQDADDAACEAWDIENGVEYITISGTSGGADIFVDYGISAIPTMCLIASDHTVVMQNITPIESVSDIITPLEAQGISANTCDIILIADFIASANFIMPGEAIDFTDLSLNSPSSWSWSFPGGTPETSSEQNPTGILYSNPGTFDVTLEVSDGTNTNSFTKFGYIVVSEVPVYCDAGTVSTIYEYIDAVSFNTINNSETGSGTGGYQDYTTISTTINQGHSYPITIGLGNGYSQDKAKVWIDWNQDGDLLDSDEMVFESEIGDGPFTGDVFVPATSVPGNTRMRIRIWDTSSPEANDTPCGDSDWGEVEDYTVIIDSTGVSADELINNNIIIFPNPVENKIFVSIQDQKIYRIELTDLTGKIIFQSEIIENMNCFDLSENNSGIYFFRIYSDYGISTHKIIVK